MSWEHKVGSTIIILNGWYTYSSLIYLFNVHTCVYIEKCKFIFISHPKDQIRHHHHHNVKETTQNYNTKKHCISGMAGGGDAETAAQLRAIVRANNNW